MTHGGRRKGAGRPRRYVELVTLNICMDRRMREHIHGLAVAASAAKHRHVSPSEICGDVLLQALGEPGA